MPHNYRIFVPKSVHTGVQGIFCLVKHDVKTTTQDIAILIKFIQCKKYIAVRL